MAKGEKSPLSLVEISHARLDLEVTRPDGSTFNPELFCIVDSYSHQILYLSLAPLTWASLRAALRRISRKEKRRNDD